MSLPLTTSLWSPLCPYPLTRLTLHKVSAHDPKAPYYDPKSKPSDPKWSVVHVKFRSKFAVPITLKELREEGGAGKPLENMQMLKQSRLSVSRVSAAEWEYLVRLAEEKAKNAK